MADENQTIEATAEVIETVEMPESIDTEGLVVVKQIPIIEEHLQRIKDNIQDSVAYALSLECTEESKQEIKNLRKSLNKQFEELEEKRKSVKRAINEPYDQFEAIYKNCVTNIVKPAVEQLNAKIAAVEDAQKKAKEDKARSYFEEYKKSLEIDFVEFENVGLNITLNISDKKCKETCNAFLDKVADDITLINTQEHTEEIMVEYKSTLNASKAITTVVERYAAIEAERRKREEAEAKAKAEAEHQAAIEAAIKEEQAKNESEPTLHHFAASGPTVRAIPQSEHNQFNEQTVIPGAEPIAEKVYFEVGPFKLLNVPHSKVIKFKEFLKEEGIEYEQC